MKVTRNILRKARAAIRAAMEYEEATGGRDLGITGEIGEVLTAHKLGLDLNERQRQQGYDATDGDGKRVEIKTRRGDAKRVGRYSGSLYDCVILCILDSRFRVKS